MTVALDTDSIEAVARRVAELLRGESVAGELIDAAEVAHRFNVSRSWVYEHATQLGAITLGNGDKPRLRFDPATVYEQLAARPAPVTAPRGSARRPRASAALLPIRHPRPTQGGTN